MCRNGGESATWNNDLDTFCYELWKTLQQLKVLRRLVQPIEYDVEIAVVGQNVSDDVDKIFRENGGIAGLFLLVHTDCDLRSCFWPWQNLVDNMPEDFQYGLFTVASEEVVDHCRVSLTRYIVHDGRGQNSLACSRCAINPEGSLCGRGDCVSPAHVRR